jgi:hypothetical protein
VAKLYDINPELVEDRGFLDLLKVRTTHFEHPEQDTYVATGHVLLSFTMRRGITQSWGKSTINGGIMPSCLLLEVACVVFGTR